MLKNVADELELRRRARAALHAGNLPRYPSERMWGGTGSGNRCPVCGDSIEAAEKELELEYMADETHGVRELHLHLPCFSAWELERTSAASDGS